MMALRLLFCARSAARTCSLFASSARAFSDNRDSRVMLTHKRGMDIIQDPDLNKVINLSRYCMHGLTLENQGTGFSESEKDRLGIRGLVPPRVFEMDMQLQRIMLNLNQCRDNLEKYVFLSALSDRNLTAFYKASFL